MTFPASPVPNQSPVQQPPRARIRLAISVLVVIAVAAFGGYALGGGLTSSAGDTGSAARGSDMGLATSAGGTVSAGVMAAWASGEQADIEAIYDPSVVMQIDGETLASSRDEIEAVIGGAKAIGNTYRQMGPVIDYVASDGTRYIGTIVEVRGPGHPTGVPVVGFYRVRDGKVIRHIFMDAESY